MEHTRNLLRVLKINNKSNIGSPITDVDFEQAYTEINHLKYKVKFYAICFCIMTLIALFVLSK